MSPTKAGRSAYATTRPNRAKSARRSPAATDRGPVLDDSASESVLATERRLRRTIEQAAVGASRNSNPIPYDDPANYLG